MHQGQNLVHAGGDSGNCTRERYTTRIWKTRCFCYFLLYEVHLHVQMLRPQIMPKQNPIRASPLAAALQRFRLQPSRAVHTWCAADRNATRTRRPTPIRLTHPQVRVQRNCHRTAAQLRHRTLRHPLPAPAAMASSTSSWLFNGWCTARAHSSS